MNFFCKFLFFISKKTGRKEVKTLQQRYKTLPIRWATAKPNIFDITNVVKNRKLSLDEIRI